MEVSGLRFAHFVRRYVLHKNWKKICQAMREYHKSTKRPAHVEKYLKIMEQRMKEVKLIIWVRNYSRSDERIVPKLRIGTFIKLGRRREINN